MDYRRKQKKELDSIETVLRFENADTFRYQDKKVGFFKLQKKITDSIRRLKEFYKIE